MDLQAYLDRIGHAGPVGADLATLRALHRAHLFAIPYENLDVQFGRPLTVEPARAFDKIVRRGRGGWCYEMNGLLGAALEAIGFEVTRLAGAVHRQALGDMTVGNHLVLLVNLRGEPWIADVGFGDGIRDPFPLREGPLSADGFPYRLERLADGWWRMHNQPHGGASTFDFRTEPADPAMLAARSHELQTSPQSPFVQNLVAQKHVGDEVLILRGRVLRRVRPSGFEDRLLGSADDLVEVLERDFGLPVPEAATLWPRVLERHAQVFAGQPA